MIIPQSVPVVDAENCFEIVRSRGIQSWNASKPAIEFSQFLKDASGPDSDIAGRFAPKVEAVRHQKPDGNEFLGFRVVNRPAVCVFAVVEGLVPITAEWKHGNAKITLVPPAGVLSGSEQQRPNGFEVAARREFQEETGLALSSLEPLGPNSGMFCNVRNSLTMYRPFLGVVSDATFAKQQLDEDEHALLVLFPLHEWWRLIHATQLPDDFGLEAIARDTTLLALERLGRLHFA